MGGGTIMMKCWVGGDHDEEVVGGGDHDEVVGGDGDHDKEVLGYEGGP